MRYIFNSNTTRAAVSIPMCTKMFVKVEMQEDDMKGQTPDSAFTSISEAAFTALWIGEPSGFGDKMSIFPTFDKISSQHQPEPG